MSSYKEVLESRIARLEKLLGLNEPDTSLRQRTVEGRLPKNPGNSMVNAISNKDINRVKNLLATGAGPNEPNRYGMTPLSAAVNWRFPEAAKLLLDAGADPNIPTTHKYIDWYGDGRDFEETGTLLQDAEWNVENTYGSVNNDAKAVYDLLKRYGAK